MCDTQEKVDMSPSRSLTKIYTKFALAKQPFRQSKNNTQSTSEQDCNDGDMSVCWLPPNPVNKGYTSTVNTPNPAADPRRPTHREKPHLMLQDTYVLVRVRPFTMGYVGKLS